MSRTSDSIKGIEHALREDGDLRQCLCPGSIEDGQSGCFNGDEPHSVCPEDDAGFYQQACEFLLGSLILQYESLGDRCGEQEELLAKQENRRCVVLSLMLGNVELYHKICFGEKCGPGENGHCGAEARSLAAIAWLEGELADGGE